MKRQVRVLLPHGGGDGGAVDLVDDLQDLGNVDRLDQNVRTNGSVSGRSSERFEESLFPGFEFGEFDGAATNVESFSDVAGQRRDFGGQEGDGGRLNDRLVFVQVEVVESGGDDLADLVAGVGGEVDLGGGYAGPELQEDQDAFD